jgi:hypothetical protein
MTTPDRWHKEAERIIRAEQKRKPAGFFAKPDPEGGIDAWAPDPVHCDAEGWWFWDETWANRFGPYETESIAEERCYEYARGL